MTAAEADEWWPAAEQAAARLVADPDRWADYLAEADAWEAVAGDGLPDAGSEWPELNPEPTR